MNTVLEAQIVNPSWRAAGCTRNFFSVILRNSVIMSRTSACISHSKVHVENVGSGMPFHFCWTQTASFPVQYPRFLQNFICGFAATCKLQNFFWEPLFRLAWGCISLNTCIEFSPGYLYLVARQYKPKGWRWYITTGSMPLEGRLVPCITWCAPVHNLQLQNLSWRC